MQLFSNIYFPIIVSCSSGGTVDAAAPSLVDKFGAFSLGGSGDPTNGSADPSGHKPPHASTPSPPRGGAGGSGHWSSNRAPALTASTMSTYDTGGSANLNASTSVGSVGGAHSAGGTVSPLIFDVSPSSDAGYSGGGSRYNHNITPSLIASAGGHRRIISTGSGGSSGGANPPAPPMLERDSSQELVGEVFLPGGAAGGSNGFSRQQYQGGLDAGAESFSAGIAPRPFGSSGSHSGSEDGLRGLDALSHGSTSGSRGHRERAQTLPVPEDAHRPHALQQQQQHVRSWSTADHLQHLGGAGQGAAASSASASRLLSSSDPPRSASFGGRPPLATHSKTNLSDLLQQSSTASSGGSPGGAGGGQQQQQQRERDNSFDYLQHPPSQQGTLPVQQQRSHSIGDAYSMPEERPVHGGDAYSASASASVPRPLNQHARSYSQGSVAHRPSAGTPLYSVSVRERFSTSDGIAEHQPYGGSAAQQHQLPRSVSTGSNIVMYTDGREYSPSSTSASMRRSDSAPGHMVSPSYQHYQQDQSVHGGSRFSANRYSQPHHQQHQHHQQPQYHVADEYHEPIVLPQYGVATMPRPPAASSTGPGPKIVYHVHFKRSHRYFVLGPRAPRDIEVGTFVKVEADRGEDLGQIVDLLSAEHFNANCRSLPTAGAGYGDGGGQGGGGPGPACAADLKRITRRASREEADLLPLKSEEENELINICNDKVRQRGLPMRIVDAEYQFDRHKLTFFFESDCRVDFRELVRDLFSIYKTRIWMEQLN